MRYKLKPFFAQNGFSIHGVIIVEQNAHVLPNLVEISLTNSTELLPFSVISKWVFRDFILSLNDEAPGVLSACHEKNGRYHVL